MNHEVLWLTGTLHFPHRLQGVVIRLGVVFDKTYCPLSIEIVCIFSSVIIHRLTFRWDGSSLRNLVKSDHWTWTPTQLWRYYVEVETPKLLTRLILVKVQFWGVYRKTRLSEKNIFVKMKRFTCRNFHKNIDTNSEPQKRLNFSIKKRKRTYTYTSNLITNQNLFYPPHTISSSSMEGFRFQFYNSSPFIINCW